MITALQLHCRKIIRLQIVPDVAVAQSHLWWQYSDDGGAASIEHDRFADDTGVATESPFPEPIGNQHRILLAGREGAADHRSESEKIEQPGFGEGRWKHLGAVFA